MAKKKNSVALFEVIQKAKSGEANMDVPKWMGGEGPMPPSGEVPPPRPRPEARPAPASPASARRARGGAGEPLLSVAGDRLRLSLNIAACAVAAAGLIALLAGAFALGYWRGGASAEGELAAAGAGGPLKDRTPFGRHVLDGRAKGGGGPSGKGVANPTGADRQKGKWYLVIQALGGRTPEDLKEAARIAAFCKAHGEPATVAEYTTPRSGKQRYIVWSLRPFGFSGKPSDEALAYARKIEKLGKEYFEKHKTYDFRQRTAGGNFDPWFEVKQ